MGKPGSGQMNPGLAFPVSLAAILIYAGYGRDSFRTRRPAVSGQSIGDTGFGFQRLRVSIQISAPNIFCFLVCNSLTCPGKPRGFLITTPISAREKEDGADWGNPARIPRFSHFQRQRRRY